MNRQRERPEAVDIPPQNYPPEGDRWLAVERLYSVYQGSDTALIAPSGAARSGRRTRGERVAGLAPLSPPLTHLQSTAARPVATRGWTIVLGCPCVVSIVLRRRGTDHPSVYAPRGPPR
jgi:hypothetical protein